jgi:peptidoglycan/xylan/chitin deacetylase (PgdA/CDA1 family)
LTLIPFNMRNVIINFHDVKDSKWFEETLLFLKSKFNIIGIEELEKFYHSNLELKNSCLITVDDGEKSFIKVMLPIFEKLKIPCTLFVSPKIILENSNFWFQEIRTFDEIKLNRLIENEFPKIFNPDRSAKNNLKVLQVSQILNLINSYKEVNSIHKTESYNIDCEDLMLLSKNKLVTLGAHTMNHPILKNETDIVSFDEIANSIDQLEKLISKRVKFFAYPNGIPNSDYSQREVEYLKNLGISLAFSTSHKEFEKTDCHLEIPRIGISKGSTNFIYFKIYFAKYWRKLKQLRKAIKF